MPSHFSIPYSRQEISEEDIHAVVSVLRSDYLTQGPHTARFEALLAGYCNAAHAAVVSSGTAALHLCMLALDAKRVWTSPISFVASANCARYVGAAIDFVDVEADTGNMSVNALEAKLQKAAAANSLPDIVIPVHFSGRACDLDAMYQLSERYNFRIVEDAAHALGARYPSGSVVGNGALSAATILSFHPVKAITTAEGGAVLSHTPELIDRVRILRSHGIVKDAGQFIFARPEEWYYEQQTLGYHYRMNDMQAALGASQIERLDDFIARRRAIAVRYQSGLSGLPLDLPPPDPGAAWHLYVVRVPSASHVTRDSLFRALRDRGIGVQVHYHPIHLQPDYQHLGFHPSAFPNAERFSSSALSIPIFPGLTFEEQDYVVQSLTEILQ